MFLLIKEGTRTVELKQTVGTKTFYPSKTVTSNLQDNPLIQRNLALKRQSTKQTQ
jgi:hypothetical protein